MVAFSCLLELRASLRSLHESLSRTAKLVGGLLDHTGLTGNTLQASSIGGILPLVITVLGIFKIWLQAGEFSVLVS